MTIIRFVTGLAWVFCVATGVVMMTTILHPETLPADAHVAWRWIVIIFMVTLAWLIAYYNINDDDAGNKK